MSYFSLIFTHHQQIECVVLMINRYIIENSAKGSNIGNCRGHRWTYSIASVGKETLCSTISMGKMLKLLLVCLQPQLLYIPWLPSVHEILCHTMQLILSFICIFLQISIIFHHFNIIHHSFLQKQSSHHSKMYFM